MHIWEPGVGHSRGVQERWVTLIHLLQAGLCFQLFLVSEMQVSLWDDTAKMCIALQTKDNWVKFKWELVRFSSILFTVYI